MKKLLTLFFLSAAAPCLLFSQDKPGKLLPSEALILMYNAVDMNPETERLDLTKPYLDRVITTGLSPDEMFHLGDIYFWDFMPKESKNAFQQFLGETDLRGRSAWERMMQIEFRAYEMYDDVERKLEEFRKQFKPDPNDRYYMYGQVYNVASRYKEAGDHNKVLQLINEEISSLDYQGAYRSFELPIYFNDSYKVLNKNKEAVAILTKAKIGLSKTLEARKKSMPEKEFKYVEHGDAVAGMLTPFSEKLSYSQMNAKFETLIGRLDDAIKKFSQRSNE